MKEKAIIFSDYRQPYNFLAHEEAAPDPVDASTPLPATSKADSYPRRHKRPTSFHDPEPGQPGFNLRKHHSESAFPMQALQRKSGVDSPRERRGTSHRTGSVLQGPIREEPLEEQRLAEETGSGPGVPGGTESPRGASTPRNSEIASVTATKAKSKTKFWKRKSKEKLDSKSVQGGAPDTPESPKKKKKLFGRKDRSGSRISLNVSQENVASSSGQQGESEIVDTKPPISPSKKKIWQRKKSNSQASLGATSPGPEESGGTSDGGLDADDTGKHGRGKRGSILGRLSKSGSKTSISKSGSKSSLSQSEENIDLERDGSPRKRRSSFLGKLSRSGSKSSLSKSQSSVEDLANEDPGKSPKRKSSLLRRLSKSRSSISKSEDSLEGDPSLHVDGSKITRSVGEGEPTQASRKLSVLSKSSKTGSRRSSKTQEAESPSSRGGWKRD